MKRLRLLRQLVGSATGRAFALGMAVWLVLFAVLATSTPEGARQAGVYVPLGVLAPGTDPETGERIVRPRLAPL